MVSTDPTSVAMLQTVQCSFEELIFFSINLSSSEIYSQLNSYERYVKSLLTAVVVSSPSRRAIDSYGVMWYNTCYRIEPRNMQRNKCYVRPNTRTACEGSRRKRKRERLITKEIIIGTHAPRAVGLTIGLPPPHLHLLLGSYGCADARELHMPMAFLRDKMPKAYCLSSESPQIPTREKGEIMSSRNSLLVTNFLHLNDSQKERNR